MSWAKWWAEILNFHFLYNLKRRWGQSYRDRHSSCLFGHPIPSCWAKRCLTCPLVLFYSEDFYGRCEILWFRKTLLQHLWMELDSDKSLVEGGNGGRALMPSMLAFPQTIGIVCVGRAIYWPNLGTKYINDGCCILNAAINYLFVIYVPSYVGGWEWSANGACRFEIIIGEKSLFLYNHTGLFVRQLYHLHNSESDVGVK